MKTHQNIFKRSCFAFTLFFLFTFTYAQKPRLAVGFVDVKGTSFDQVQQTNLLRNEIEKLDSFEIIDKYELDDIARQNGYDLGITFSKEKLITVGTLAKADYVVSAGYELFNDKLVVKIRLLDVARNTLTKTVINEYNSYMPAIQFMLNISVNQLFNRSYDHAMNERLSKKSDYESPINQPMSITQLNLSGPRMGATLLFGGDAEILQARKVDGGFDLNPLMFQLGYQFEKQYLNSGTWQGLIEFIPMITGIDQNEFLPSFTLLNGLRNNINGWELGLGGTIAFQRMIEGFDAPDGKFHPLDDWRLFPVLSSEPANTYARFDSRGSIELMTAVVIGAGKSFRSGRLNIPFNLWIMPQKNAIRSGLSVGFNSKKER